MTERLVLIIAVAAIIVSLTGAAALLVAELQR